MAVRRCWFVNSYRVSVSRRHKSSLQQKQQEKKDYNNPPHACPSPLDLLLVIFGSCFLCAASRRGWRGVDYEQPLFDFIFSCATPHHTTADKAPNTFSLRPPYTHSLPPRPLPKPSLLQPRSQPRPNAATGLGLWCLMCCDPPQSVQRRPAQPCLRHHIRPAAAHPICGHHFILQGLRGVCHTPPPPPAPPTGSTPATHTDRAFIAASSATRAN